MRLRILDKIILPFSVLLIFVGVIGTAVATARLTDAAQAQFDANLLHSSLVANQSMAKLEAARMADLRQATATVGVPEAIAGGDLEGLVRLMVPIAANIKPTVASIQLRVLDSRGREVLRIASTAAGVGAVEVTDANAFTAEPAVIKLLAGEADAQGERRIFLSGNRAQPVLYWAGPVHAVGTRILQHRHMWKSQVIEAGVIQPGNQATLDRARWVTQKRTNEHCVRGRPKFSR